MATASELSGLGLAPELAGRVAQGVHDTATGLTAAGTTIADALKLTKGVNVIGTAAASTGVKLPPFSVGSQVFIKNGGAQTVNIFPNTSSEKINGGSAGAAVTLATTKSALLFKVGAIDWVSVGLD